MSELQAGFRSLPTEFQEVILLAQDRFHIGVAPLQALAGGFSGASVYLVSVALQEKGIVEHCILKLDHKNEKARSDEVSRHQAALSASPPQFAECYMARMLFDKVEQSGAMAIFYEIAGQSLHLFRPLSAYETQEHATAIFKETLQRLLTDWNAQSHIQQAVHPQKLLEQWLGFRLQPGAPIEQFLVATCAVPADQPGFFIHDTLYPNPLAYARYGELWGNARPIDLLTGFQHGDLNVNNILVKFARQTASIDGYYLIDFALFKEQMPLLYDLRYLEMSFLNLRQQQVPFSRLVDLLLSYQERELPDPHRFPMEMAGIYGVVGALHAFFAEWVNENHPSMQDDLWGQYWLAGTAAGLCYCHKAASSDTERMAGLVFAAANLKRYMTLFGLPAPDRGSRLFDPRQWDHARTEHGPISMPSPRSPSNLPIQATSFIGREKELTVLRDLLQDEQARLITLTGPGGTGKTRLSLQAASGVEGVFRSGVFFIDLAEAGTPEMVVSKIARTLGVREGSSLPLFETLQEYLHEKQMLLILDNMEQVVSAAREVAELLAGAPGLKILATSRILLQVRGEREVAVPPLGLPGSADLDDPTVVSAGESIRLFVERAQGANLHFALNRENARTVAEICRQLDGLPLAIELAAARIKILSPDALLSRLGRRLAVLTGGGRDLPARQQALRSTLDWSYSLLQEAEKTLFARLSVFAGGFTLEIAEEVCNPDGNLDVLEGVTVLVNNSLLRQEAGQDGQPRLRMLEIMREYAQERLVQRGELGNFQRAHGMYFINKVMNEAGYKIYSAVAVRWLNWFESEHDNLQAALAWGSAQPQLLEVVSPMVFLLAWFWYRRGYFNEGRIWAERMMQATQGQGVTGARAYALTSTAFLALWRGDLKTAYTSSVENIEMWHHLENERGIAAACMNLGIIHLNMGNDTASQPLLKEALGIFEGMQDTFFIATASVHLGNVSLGMGRPQEALGWLDKAYPLSRVVGDEWLISFALNNLGEVARVMGDYPKARRYYEESESLLRATGDKGDLARLVHNLGCVAQHEGDFARAEKLLLDSLALFRKLGNQRGVAECLAAMAHLSAAQDQPQIAARLLGTAEGMLAGIGAAWWPADRGEIQGCREAVQTRLGTDAFMSEFDRGGAMNVDQALETFARGS